MVPIKTFSPLCNLTTCPWHPEHSFEGLIGLFPCISCAQKKIIFSMSQCPSVPTTEQGILPSPFVMAQATKRHLSKY